MESSTLEKEFVGEIMPSSSRLNHAATATANHLLDNVPLLDIGRENAPLESKILAAITQVMRSGRFVLGPEVQQLENRIARLCQVPHAVGCASGSDALLLALMALDIQPGDEVIVPSFTFFATASAAWRLGAVPVFVDIDATTFNIDPAAVRSAITKKTKAIIPVHLFGQPADMTSLLEIAREHNLYVVEDAAQAIGAAANGTSVGAMGDVGCFSFYPTKNLGGFGDSGMLTTTSDEIADRLELLRGHGMRPRYYHESVGVNSRLDTMQAVVLNVKLPHLPSWSKARAKNAARYDKMFREAGLDQQIGLPTLPPTSVTSVWNQYTIRVPNGRDDMRNWLAKKHVGTEVYYPVPLHRQACFQSLEQRFALPETERAAAEVLSLPIFPSITVAEQQTVVSRIAQYLHTQSAAIAKRKAA